MTRPLFATLYSTTRAEHILRALRDSCGLTVDEIARESGVCVRQVRRYMNHLKARGLVRLLRMRRDGAKVWDVTQRCPTCGRMQPVAKAAE